MRALEAGVVSWAEVDDGLALRGVETLWRVRVRKIRVAFLGRDRLDNLLRRGGREGGHRRGSEEETRHGDAVPPRCDISGPHTLGWFGFGEGGLF